MMDQNLTTLEAVAMAVRSEMESTDLYGNLIKKIKNPAVVQVLQELAEDEEKHRVGLMNLYKEMLGGEEPAIPESDGRKKQWDIDPDADHLTVMTKARDKEYDSEEFYKKAAERVRDYKTREFFLDLAETERQHAVALQKQVEKLKEDPHWFDRADATQVHEGP